jgi:DNA-directed RNA polymerase subunit RPC12/RpoP
VLIRRRCLWSAFPPYHPPFSNSHGQLSSDDTRRLGPPTFVVRWQNHVGLIRLIKSLFAPKMPSIGNTEPVCPYCAYRLDKMPGRKKKCPGCGHPILVRTRPSDQKRILIREDQDLQIKEQWAIVNGDHKWFLAERKRFDAERENLRKRFGREPSKNDVEWAQLNRALLKHARDSDWGLYRSDWLTMGDIRRKEGRHLEALDLYFGLLSRICGCVLAREVDPGCVIERVLRPVPFENRTTFSLPISLCC